MSSRMSLVGLSLFAAAAGCAALVRETETETETGADGGGGALASAGASADGGHPFGGGGGEGAGPPSSGGGDPCAPSIVATTGPDAPGVTKIVLDNPACAGFDLFVYPTCGVYGCEETPPARLDSWSEGAWVEQDQCGCTCAPPGEPYLVTAGEARTWTVGHVCAEVGATHRWRMRFTQGASTCADEAWDGWECAETELGWIELATPPYAAP